MVFTTFVDGTTAVASEVNANFDVVIRGDASFAIFRDEKTQNTAGGTFTSGAWQTRTLNTTQVNNITGASLSSNQITLPAATYYISATGPVNEVSQNQMKLRNITDGTDELLGVNNYALTGQNAGTAVLSGVITITGTKTFELQHRASVTRLNNGFGMACNFTTEVYATITIMRLY